MAWGHFARSPIRFSVRFVAKRYVLHSKQKCLKKWIGSCVLEIRWYNFNPLHQPWTPQYLALQTDRQTDQTTLWWQWWSA